MTLQMGEDDQRYLLSKERPASPSRRRLSAVDLFSGCGGLTLGVEEAARQLGRKLDVRLASEFDSRIAEAYAANFGGGHHVGGDVRSWFDKAPGKTISPVEQATRELVGASLDILVGGPPCQGHSTLNNYTRGDDPKNALYLVMLRAAEVLQPLGLLIENVPAIQRDRGGVVERTVRRLEGLGYWVDQRVISVAQIGVPQLRKRHVLIAHRSGVPSLEDALRPALVEEPRSVHWAIRDLSQGSTMFDTAGTLTAENKRRAKFLLDRNAFDLPNARRPNCQRGEHKYKSMYGRLNWCEPAQTITTGFGSPGQGRYFHPREPRTLTPHEAARLQFFPDWFDFSSFAHRRYLARAIGNAVPPKLSFVLAHHLFSLDARLRSKLPAAKPKAGQIPLSWGSAARP